MINCKNVLEDAEFVLGAMAFFAIVALFSFLKGVGISKSDDLLGLKRGLEDEQ